MEENEERDDTVERATKDDHLAAELLMLLSRPRPAKDLKLHVVQQPLKWCIRKPRSRQIDLAGIRKSKEEEEEEDGGGGGKPKRASPKSPLSWSGGENPSSSRCAQGAVPSGGGAEMGKSTNDVSKRLKITIGGRNKKKSLAELKEEENNLLLEKVDLHKKLEEWKTNYDELSRRNLSLKEKLKTHLESQPSGMNIDAAASSPLPMAFPHPPSSNAAASSPLTMSLPHPSSSNAAAASPEKVAVAVPPIKVVGASSQLPMALPYSLSIEATAAAPVGVMVGVASSSSQAVASSSSRKALFRLPDLNMIPEPEE
ncbi:hypothetical protein MRB53_009136 [Persea americana]|uniref:Uncharacterized protein n=1 Tax=Persea americana TaxID=3435 RepID=A0ACC2LN54_PERAE|nr:hypothetical protein MRB53_009136 [Persea americana]|eukprot:TRINITY_DN8491_c0_g2_i2.p1 TRINITY_DN8491_c0_g2~~TRINITY_DN8491_c0_g2_i2.p1  ORF type:complete len:313 (-),score=77.00 TRINITY_DN8491_c0_g2_i2:484-1422(-)